MSAAQTAPNRPAQGNAQHVATQHPASTKYTLKATAKFVPATAGDKEKYQIRWTIDPAAPAGSRFEVVRGDQDHALNIDEKEKTFVVKDFAEIPLKDGSYSVSTEVFSAGQENDFEVVAHNVSGTKIADSGKIVGASTTVSSDNTNPAKSDTSADKAAAALPGPNPTLAPVASNFSQIQVLNSNVTGQVTFFSSPDVSSCGPGGTKLPLVTNTSNKIEPSTTATFEFATPLQTGTVLCAVLSDSASKLSATTDAITIGAPKTTLGPSINGSLIDGGDVIDVALGDATPGSTVRVFSVPGKNFACSNSIPTQTIDIVSQSGSMTVGQSDTAFVLTRKLKKKEFICAVLIPPGGVLGNGASTAVVQVGPADPPSTPFDFPHILALGGIDVSASASTDPAAHFLLSGSFESPLSQVPSIASKFWIGGNIQLSSISEQTPVSAASSPSTSVSALTNSNPSQLVQSFEASIAPEFSLFHPKTQTVGAPATTIHLIAEGGMVTPLSPDQANPPIYIVTQALYSYYTMMPYPSAAAQTAITQNCKTFTAGSCYVTYVPEGRTRFYRDWLAGFRFRFYYPADPTTRKYLFPSSGTIAIGENEYVTAGHLHGLVLHAGGKVLVPAPYSSKLAGFLYVYGSVDMNINGKNQSSPQFLLQTAASTVTAATTGVATISVPDQNRDRYRFGVALDLGKLISLMTSSSGNGSGDSGK